MILFGFGARKTEAVPTEPSVPMFRSVSVSETGLVRAENQDHVFADDEHGVYAVADGVGGGSEGAMASEIVCRNLKMWLAGEVSDFVSVVDAVGSAIREANAAILAYREEAGYEMMASTIAVLVVDRTNPHHAAVTHVGDSRVYRIARGMPSLLTHDHRLTAEEHDLFRAVGASDRISVDWLEINGGAARYLLCTDGVHDVSTMSRLGVFASVGAIEVAAERLKRDVLKHGAPDNFSFVLVET